MVDMLSQPLRNQLGLGLDLAQESRSGLFLNTEISQRRRLVTLDGRRNMLNLHEVASDTSAHSHNNVLNPEHKVTPNDPSLATRRTGRNDCNRDALGGFAAARG